MGRSRSRSVQGKPPVKHHEKMWKVQNGFTLLELLVVVAIVSVLLAGGVTLFSGAQAKSRDARRQADLEAVRSALELYRSDNSTIGYPNAIGTDGTNAKYSNLCCDGGEPLVNYIDAMPQDPRNPTYYYTYSRTSGSTYSLCESDFETYTGTSCPSGYSYVSPRCCLSPP